MATSSPGVAPMTGAIVDCGSGHTSLTFYTYNPTPSPPAVGTRGGVLTELGRAWVKHAVDGGNVPLTDICPGAKGDTFKGTTLEERTDEFIATLCEALDNPINPKTKERLVLPVGPVSMLYIGATGGMREAVATGRLTEAQLEATRARFAAGFGEHRSKEVVFELITGAAEARWELEGAETIWGAHSAAMFPGRKEGEPLGLFSGGGKSMQLASPALGALSFPFSTFPAYLEERQGASPTAWLDDVKWQTFEAELVAKVEAEAPKHAKFGGCFVATAMNHRAALYAGIDGRPITAAEAVIALRRHLPNIRAQTGELHEKMMATLSPGSTYPVARITAMHTFRLATVLAAMFEPGAKLFFARNGIDAAGNSIDCEWTVGAFAELARRTR